MHREVAAITTDSRKIEEGFDELDKAEKRLADAEARLESVRKQALTKDSIIEVLKIFEKIYDKMSEYEQKTFMQSFIDSIEPYPKDSNRRGTTVKTIHFRFPVSYNGEVVYEISLPKENTVETVVLMSRKDK